jgi:hypothetical protein
MLSSLMVLTTCWFIVKFHLRLRTLFCLLFELYLHWDFLSGRILNLNDVDVIFSPIGTASQDGECISEAGSEKAGLTIAGTKSQGSVAASLQLMLRTLTNDFYRAQGFGMSTVPRNRRDKETGKGIIFLDALH